MAAAGIFISYRRDDAAGYARAVGEELARHFGAERVFIDVDDIGAGLAFDEVIERELGAARVLLVLIGKRWRGERPGQPARIDDPADPVRREVAAGLTRGLRVVPLLLDGAPMPAPAELPEPLRPLAGRHALELGNARYAADMARLIAALRDALGEPAPATSAAEPSRASTAQPRHRFGRYAGSTAAAASLAIAVGVVLTWGPWRAGPARQAPAGVAAPPPATSQAGPAFARAAIDGDWQAEVTYDWPGARHVERFRFGGEAGDLHGSASFLGMPRGVLEGSVDATGLRFATRTDEVAGDARREAVHRYHGRLVGDELHFLMQTESGFGSHAPVEFVARRTSSSGR